MEGPRGLDQLGRAVLEGICAAHAGHGRRPTTLRPWVSITKSTRPRPHRSRPGSQAAPDRQARRRAPRDPSRSRARAGAGRPVDRLIAPDRGRPLTRKCTAPRIAAHLRSHDDRG
jgi:hypothetical protein